MAIHKIKIFSGRGSEYLAEKIAASFGTTLGQSEVLRFSDGEFQPCYNESIRGCTVFIIQSTFPPSDNLMELLMMIDAARRASAYKVVAVIPYFGWARQDRKDRPRVPIGAKLVANLLMAAGVDRVMTMDLHADQIGSGGADCLRNLVRISLLAVHQQGDILRLRFIQPAAKATEVIRHFGFSRDRKDHDTLLVARVLRRKFSADSVDGKIILLLDSIGKLSHALFAGVVQNSHFDCHILSS